MTQYKTVIVPTPCDATSISYGVAAEAITKAIQEEAKDGWEIALAQEMEASNNKGLIGSLFGSKQKQKHTLLVFKKEEKKPEVKPKDFDYDKFEEIVAKGMDMDKFANVMKKVVSETEVTISKKSFQGLKFAMPAPALPMNESEEPQQATVSLSDDPTISDAIFREVPDKDKKNGKSSENDDKNVAIARVLFEVFTENAGKGLSFSEIREKCEGKLPEGTEEQEVVTILMALVNNKKVKKEAGLFLI